MGTYIEWSGRLLAYKIKQIPVDGAMLDYLDLEDGLQYLPRGVCLDANF